jgi:hypothetical protein
MQQPQVGKTVSPAIDTAGGTSSLHGNAADATTQHAWHCAFTRLQLSQSDLHPRMPQGHKHGASGLQQHSKLQQQMPAY